MQATIETNLKQIDADAAGLAGLSPLLPFAPSIVQLVEARIRLEDVDAEHAAGVVVEIAQQADAARTRVEAGLAPSAPSDALRVDKDLAARTAAAVDTLRAALAEWFNFYNGYDPTFTWWMGMPYQRRSTRRSRTTRRSSATRLPTPPCP